MPLCFCGNNNNNKKDDYIYCMYTTLLQVIFITCVQINSTDKKNNNGHFHLGSKNLDWKKHSQTHHQNKVLFPLRRRFADKCNKLNKWTIEKFKCHPLKCRGVPVRRPDVSLRCHDDTRLSMPVLCISLKWGIFIALFFHSSVHSSVRPHRQYIPLVCRKPLPSEIQKEIQSNKNKITILCYYEIRRIPQDRPQWLKQ